MSLDSSILFRFRLAIARLGERDLFHWWESSALSEEGRYALARLFRQSSAWASAQLVIEAARSRHEAFLPPGRRITLFNLTTNIEDAFSVWFARAKADNLIEVLDLPPLPETARSSVQEALAALAIRVKQIQPKSVTDHAIQVAEIEDSEFEDDAVSIVENLLGAYVLCGKAEFRTPYMTLK